MRLGLMSFAHLHAENYLAALLAMPDVTVIGIADDNAQRAAHFAKLFKVRLFDDYAALLREKPDGVIITSENARHLPLVEMAAAAGAAILCEKPLATTREDAQKIVDICQQAHVPLMTAFPMRFNAPAIEIKKLLDSGRPGAIWGCNTTNQGALPIFHQADNLAFLNRDWFTNQQLAGGGAVVDHVVHLADLMRWFFGSEVTEVFAETNTILHAGQVDVETGGLVMLTFANGIFASIDCSWSKPAYYPTWGGLKMELVGENGLMTLDAYKQMITIYSDKAQRPQWGFWGSDANDGLLREFIAAIREKRTPAITGQDGYQAVEIVMAAYQSAQTGQSVML